MQVFSYVVYEVVERVAIITLNRPTKSNALNFTVINELKEAFSLAERDENVKIVLFKALGLDFCTGMDLEYLKELQSYDFEALIFDSQNLLDLYTLMQKLRKVILVQCQGLALASGLGLILASDICITTTGAGFGCREVKFGFIPAIMALMLVRKIGESRARYLLLTGETINADEAWGLGLVHRVVPEHQLEEAVIQMTVRLCNQNASGAMEFTKKMLYDSQALSLTDAQLFAVRMNAHGRITPESQFAITNFLDGNPFQW